jgi:hypothetical protein
MRITFVFLFFFNTAFAQIPYLEWINPNTKLRQRFSIPTNKLSSEKPNGTWLDTTLTHINPQDFAGLNSNLRTRSFVLKGNKRIYITINGGQRVYAFDLSTNNLSRVDRTWNNGYNYHSAQFIRKDTIYSLGGYGFWQYNNLITYFDSNKKEWEMLPYTGKSPKTIVNGYQGFDAQQDCFYSGAAETTGECKNPLEREFDDGFYRLDFKTKNWRYLGKLNADLPYKASRNIAWNGTYFIHFSQEKLYIMSPLENKIWTVADGKNYFDTYYRFYTHGDTLICFSSEKFGSTKYNIKKLMHRAKLLGPMYVTPIAIYSNYGLIALLLLGMGLIGYKFIRNKIQSRTIKDISFKNQELTLITEFIKLSEGEFLTSNEINEIIGISDKGLENQRKIRTAVISQINDKIAMHYHIGDAIERKDHLEDKRLKLYKLKKKALVFLKKSVISEFDKK